MHALSLDLSMSFVLAYASSSNLIHYYYQASTFQGATYPVRKYKEHARGYSAPRLDWGAGVLCKYVTVS
jgi:hypothetical protein